MNQTEVEARGKSCDEMANAFFSEIAELDRADKATIATMLAHKVLVSNANTLTEYEADRLMFCTMLLMIG
jgi:hypothetical protein